MSRAAISERRLSTIPVEVVRQLLTGMIDHAVQMEGVDHFDDRAVLVEHAIHRFAHADEDTFGQTFQRPRQVVLEAQIGATGSKP